MIRIFNNQGLIPAGAQQTQNGNPHIPSENEEMEIVFVEDH